MGWSIDNSQVAAEAAEAAEAERLLTKAEREATEVVRLETLAVKEANKTKYLPSVSTVALRNSTYPNPLNGDTVKVTGDSSMYRFQTGTGWVKTDEYNPTAIDNVTALLAETLRKEPFNLYVGINQQFQTITDAVNHWINTLNKEETIIHIHKGEYNEVVRIVTGSPKLSFIGEGKKDVIWRTKTGYYDDAPLFISGDVLIKGITFIADHSDNPSFTYTAYSGAGTGVAYGLHIDAAPPEGEVIIEDCDLISYQTAGLGSGTRINQQIKLVRTNVYSYSEIPETIPSGAWIYHTSATAGATNQKVSARDCYFYHANGKPVYLRSFHTDVTVPVEFINCNFASGVVVTSYVEFTNGNQIIITENSSGNNEPFVNGEASKKSMFGGKLITDLNNALYGRYLCDGSLVGLNTPTAEWYIVDAIAYSPTRVVQYAYAFLNGFKKYKRTCNGGVWTSWVHIVEEKEPVLITDLNTFDNGKFKIEASGLNAPTASIYVGEAISYSATAGKVQYAYAVLDAMKKYKRSYTGGAWSAWVLITEP